MKKIKLALLFLSLLIIIVLSVGCNQNDQKLANDNKNISKSQSKQENSQQNIGMLDIKTKDLDGNEFSGEEFKNNKLTVVNVWGTWCPPCVKELPELQRISENYKEKNVEVIGIMQDSVNQFMIEDEETIAEAKKLFEENSINYTNIMPDEIIMTGLLSQISSFPTTLFVNNQGEIIDMAVGARSYSEWSQKIDEVLKQIGE